MAWLCAPFWWGYSPKRKARHGVNRHTTSNFATEAKAQEHHGRQRRNSGSSRRTGQAPRRYDVESSSGIHSNLNGIGNGARAFHLRGYHRPHPIPLDRESRAFRIFVLEEGPRTATIAGRLEYWSLERHPVYQALSYTWNNSIYVSKTHRRENPDSDNRMIRLDGRDLLVGANLYEALRHLRKEDHARNLWIDAICIDQANIDERNHQVALMTEIYRHADSVVAWLGPSDRASAITLGLVKDLDVAEDYDHCIDIIEDALGNPNYDFRSVYTSLFQRAYWRRTWVIQEIFSAQRIIVQCGKYVVPWTAMVSFHRVLRNEHLYGMNRYHPWTPHISPEEIEDTIKGAMRLINLSQLRLLRLPERPDTVDCPLHDLLLQHADAAATDPRDKVYALFRLARDRNEYNIDVDYRLEVNEVYTNVVREYIRIYANLSIILICRPKNFEHQLPSWCPDWSWTTPTTDSGCFWRDAYPFQTAGRPYDASRVDSPDPRCDVHFSPCGQIMRASGWRVDSVRDHSRKVKFQKKRRPKKSLGILSWLGIGSRKTPRPKSSVSEFQTWYAIHRRALRRGYRADAEHNLARYGRGGFFTYCRKKHAEFLRVVIRATTVDAGMEPRNDVEEGINAQWNRHNDVPNHYTQHLTEVMNSGLQRVLRHFSQGNMHKSHRCFFVTDSGIMGLAPTKTRKNDVICIFRGCTLPVMLRFDGAHYKFIGACFVAGFMHGQFGRYQQHYGIQERLFEIS